MSHARTTIKNQIVAAVTGLTTTGSRVFGPERRRFSDEELPCLRVFTESEEVDEEVEDKFAGVQRRECVVVLEARVKDSGDIDTVIDNIDAETETAIYAASLSTHSIDYLGIEKDFEPGLDQPQCLAKMRYKAKYLTKAGTPGSLI